MPLTELEIAQMLQEKLKSYIKSALTNLYRYDYDLICNKTNTHVFEPALSARIAMHLRDQLRHNTYGIDFERCALAGYRVDCEYNKDKADAKEDPNGDKRRPDILIHKQNRRKNTPKRNILFCEVKWENLDLDDKYKLTKMARKYEYYCSLGISDIYRDKISLAYGFRDSDYKLQSETYIWNAKKKSLE